MLLFVVYGCQNKSLKTYWLEQCTFIFLQLCRSGVQPWIHQIKMNGGQGGVSSWRLQGRIRFPAHWGQWQSPGRARVLRGRKFQFPCWLSAGATLSPCRHLSGPCTELPTSPAATGWWILLMLPFLWLPPFPSYSTFQDSCSSGWGSPR